jgi:hypothetical protein
MHIGKMMARLNPSNVRFDVGSGGTPNLTAADIAAALGMVPAGLGRELLCLVWWPAGASLTAADLAKILSDAQRVEWRRREERLLDATLSVAVHTGGDSLREAQRKYAAAHAARWPRWIVDAELGTANAGYERVRGAVLAELASPGKCPTCGGRGSTAADGLVITCRQCTGTGNRRISDAWRAEALNITEGGYRHTWRPVYEWTIELCADALRVAASKMEAASV